MADGVPASEVYAALRTPAGRERAFRKLDSLRDHIRWWVEPRVAVEMLADGDVAMTTSFNGRMFHARFVDGQPFRIVWHGQVLQIGQLGIVRGTPRLSQAFRFIRLASSTEAIATLARRTAYSPSRESAFPSGHDPRRIGSGPRASPADHAGKHGVRPSAAIGAGGATTSTRWTSFSAPGSTGSEAPGNTGRAGWHRGATGEGPPTFWSAPRPGGPRNALRPRQRWRSPCSPSPISTCVLQVSKRCPLALNRTELVSPGARLILGVGPSSTPFDRCTSTRTRETGSAAVLTTVPVKVSVAASKRSSGGRRCASPERFPLPRTESRTRPTPLRARPRNRVRHPSRVLPPRRSRAAAPVRVRTRGWLAVPSGAPLTARSHRAPPKPRIHAHIPTDPGEQTRRGAYGAISEHSMPATTYDRECPSESNASGGSTTRQ